MDADPPFFATAWFWLLFTLVIVVVALRLLLSPAITAVARVALRLIPGYSGAVDHVGISFIPLRVRIEDLALSPDDERDKEPFLFVPCAEVSLSIAALLKGRVVAHAVIVRPRVLLPMPSAPAEQEAKRTTTARTPSPAEWLSKITPFKVDRFELRHGEIILGEEVKVTEIELTIDNVTNQRKLDANAPAALAMHGRIQNTGHLSVMASAEPMAPLPTFSGQAEITGLQLRELRALVAEKTALSPSGLFECFVVLTALDGRLNGAVKPVVRDPAIAAATAKAGDAVKAKLADAAIHAISLEGETHDTIATTLPIRGTLTAPQVQLWATVLGLFRNAFFEGLRNGFANMPAAASEDARGALSLDVERERPHRPRPPERRS